MTLLDFRRALPQAGAALLAGALLSGCSDMAAPGELLRSWGLFDAGEPEDPRLAARVAAERAAEVPGAADDWPRVGSVPDSAPAATPLEDRRRLAGELRAARDGAAPGPAPVLSPPQRPPSAMAPGPGALLPGSPARAAVIYFLHDSVRLSTEDKTVLRRVADTQRALDADLRVVGHASPRAAHGAARAEVANFRVALRRARVVAAELARLGVPHARILIESRSDNAPEFSNATPHGEAANRRADIYFLAPEAPG